MTTNQSRMTLSFPVFRHQGDFGPPPATRQAPAPESAAQIDHCGAAACSHDTVSIQAGGRGRGDFVRSGERGTDSGDGVRALRHRAELFGVGGRGQHDGFRLFISAAGKPHRFRNLVAGLAFLRLIVG